MATFTWIRADLAPQPLSINFDVGQVFEVETGEPFELTPAASGGVAPYTFALQAGTLPGGWSFNATTGRISTDAAGAASTVSGLVIRVADSASATADLGPFDLLISAVPVDPPADLPTPLAVVYVDFDAVTNGTGSEVSPLNTLPGQSVTDSRVNPGTHVRCKGTWLGGTSSFGLLRRAGNAVHPVVYDFNAAGWGKGRMRAADVLTTATCANSGEAFGNASWASIQRFSLTGVSADYVRGIYDGAEPGTPACLPDLSDDELYDYDQWYPLTFAEVCWPNATWVPATSRCRIDLANLSAGARAAVLACRAADQAPVLQLRFSPNVLKEVPCLFADSDGTPNPLGGEYLVGVNPIGSGTPYAAGNSNGRWMVQHLAKAITRPGRYATNPVAGWGLHWPRAGGRPIHRATMKTGLGVSDDHIWMAGADFECFTGQRAYGAPGRRTGLRILNCKFPGSTQTSKTSVLDLAVGADSLVVKHCTFGRTMRGAQLRLGLCQNVDISCNSFDRCGDTALNIGGDGPAVNVLVRGNRITNCNGGHGNGLTFYINGYNAVLEWNVVQNCARPFTMELGNTHVWDEATYGPAGLKLRNNLFQLSGADSLAWAIMLQEGTEYIRGLELTNNRADGGVNNKAIFLKAVNTLETMSANGNILLGVRGEGANATVLTPVNTVYDADSSEAVALRAAWLLEDVSGSVCAEGVGA